MSNSTPVRRTLGVFSLVMITVGSVDSIRNLPATALFGSNIIAFFIIASLFFLIPSALISAELASAAKEGEGGIYRWVSQAFGARAGFIAVWFQWIENVVYYPALLSYIAGTVAFLINPNLIHSKVFLITFILVAFWALTALNLLGMRTYSWFANLCGLFGLVLPMALIIAMGVAWLVSGKPVHIDLHAHALMPNFAHLGLWVTLAGVMLSMCGMEIATIHVRETKDPQRTFPKALIISCVFIITTLILGALAIAIVVPAKQLSLIAGIMQAFDVFFTAYHMHWIMPIVAIILVVGGLGGLSNWLIGPTRGLHYAGLQGHLPGWMLKENRHGAPSRLLLVQGVIVTITLIAFVIIPSINGSYWYLNVLAAQLYMLMYIMMFAAAIRLRHRNRYQKAEGYKIPGGHWGTYIVGSMGLIGSIATVLIGFEPPSNLHVGGLLHYMVMIALGIIVMSAPMLLVKKTR
jgi:amino acid transporter